MISEHGNKRRLYYHGLICKPHGAAIPPVMIFQLRATAQRCGAMLGGGVRCEKAIRQPPHVAALHPCISGPRERKSHLPGSLGSLLKYMIKYASTYLHRIKKESTLKYMKLGH